jgi:hypothetical protein
MSRCKDAPIGFQCPYRHKCPHLDTMSTRWVMEVYQECFDLREQLHRLEIDSQRRIDELQKLLLQRDQTIAQLRLQHQKQFKANKKPPALSAVLSAVLFADQGQGPSPRRAGRSSGMASTRAGSH